MVTVSHATSAYGANLHMSRSRLLLPSQYPIASRYLPALSSITTDKVVTAGQALLRVLGGHGRGKFSPTIVTSQASMVPTGTITPFTLRVYRVSLKLPYCATNE